MELLRINERKLKVTLTDEDMRAYSLTCDNLDYDNTETRRAFWSILDEAKHKTGFDAATDRVYVQVFPSRGGGCEMYVTKLGKSRDITTPITVKKEPLFVEKTLFCFDKLENMLSACACLSDCGFTSASSAFAAEERYFLLVGKDKESPPRDRDYRRGATVCDLVSEFGIKIDLSAEGWLFEHAETICAEHAVERYAALAEKARPRAGCP